MYAITKAVGTANHQLNKKRSSAVVENDHTVCISRRDGDTYMYRHLFVQLLVIHHILPPFISTIVLGLYCATHYRFSCHALSCAGHVPAPGQRAMTSFRGRYTGCFYTKLFRLYRTVIVKSTHVT